MTSTQLLRIAVVGAGMMGADHVARISQRISGAEVVAIIDPDVARAAHAQALAPGAEIRTTFELALADLEFDAVLIASPGQFHEGVIVQALEAGKRILCEKPLTPDPEAALRVVQAEMEHPRRMLQVGFMRRFDESYLQLRRLVHDEALGKVLLLHARHRNASSHLVTSEELLVRDSLVHEFDTLPWLIGERIESIEIRVPRSSRRASAGLRDPQIALLEFESGVMADVEMFINAQFGYQVSTEAVFEDGVAEIGEADGMLVRSTGTAARRIPAAFIDRFAAAYDAQVQAFVDAVQRDSLVGASAWDGYLAAVVAEGGLVAQRTGRQVALEYEPQPAFYSQAGDERPRVLAGLAEEKQHA